MFSAKILITKIFPTQTLQLKGKSLLFRNITATLEGKNIAFLLWNDLTSNPKLITNSMIDIEFRIESKEHNNRFYTDLTIIKIT
ncbi:uncharacterized protein DUF3127 [Dyadobacter jejuensis]|uniref:Uncharacterized protein DUF3127 n=1 Tax=Dyadobacter jejuensis TaxID=1082580 RepID=A0A316A6R7_9BACT|nr:uncharacterized protein DUF3127 [Dyadobacter jejuensis]